MKVTEKSRKLSMGGTCSSGVLGLNPYASRFDIWYAKINEEEEPFIMNRYIYWGLEKEAVVADHYGKRHGVELIESPKRVRDIPWQTGTPDRLIVAPSEGNHYDDVGYYEDPVSGRRLARRGVEIKTALGTHARKWNNKGGVGIGDRPAMVLRDIKQACGNVPLHYWMQCQIYMELMGFPEWDLGVLLGSSDYREYRLHYDKEFMKQAMKDLKHFWEYNVEKRIAPELDDGKMVNVYLERVYGEHSDVIREGTQLENRLAVELRDVSQTLSACEKSDKLLRASIESESDERFELQDKISQLYKRKGALRAMFREQIGTDAGIDTAVGTLKWTKNGPRARTLRENWKKD